jgi:hypothetical protein
MNFSELWKKLFSKRNQEEDIGLHIAGAIVRHRNPYEDIEVPRNDEDLSQEFIDKWIARFYLMNLPFLGLTSFNKFILHILHLH